MPRTNFRTIEIDHPSGDTREDLHAQIAEKLKSVPVEFFDGPTSEAIVMILQKQGPRPPQK